MLGLHGDKWVQPQISLSFFDILGYNENNGVNNGGNIMVYISVEDFLEKAGACVRLTRQQDLEYAMAMKNGAMDARAQLIESYIPMVAGHIKYMKGSLQSLGMVMYCMQALEKAVDSFDFMQDSETFSHRLSWYLRQATAAYIVK